MSNAEDIQAILKKIQKSIDAFQSSIPGVQRDVYDGMVKLVKDLDMKDGRLGATVKNVKTIGRLQARIEEIILSQPYIDRVKTFLNTFDAIALLQNNYFKGLVEDFSAPKVLEEVQKQSVDATIEGLTEAGIHGSVIPGVQDILRLNITTGGTFPQLLGQMRDYIIGTPEVPGAILQHTQQITTDSLNQFSAQYNQVVTDDLGLVWFQYVGSLLETSRPLCKALVEKKWVHRSELDKIVHGDFAEFKAQGGKLNKKTGLPQGMIPGTNKYNFPIYRGGYNCGHQLVPVHELVVPDFIKAKFKTA